MPQFAANLSMMFTERPFLERFAAARAAGFTAVEFLFPYGYPAENVASALHTAGLQQVLFNAPPGDWDSGERGIASLSGRDTEFDESLHTALHYAAALECQQLHIMAGISSADKAAEQTYITRLRRAADTAAAEGVRILIEPLNPVDVPGYFLDNVAYGLEMVERIDRENVGLQLDLYHAQITDGDLTRLIRRTAKVTSHIQIASVPDRHEPDVGEVNYLWLFDLLDTEGYTEAIGCEYHPAGVTEEGLGWFAPYRSNQLRESA